MRKFKYELRKLFIGKVTIQEKIDACPDNYNLDWWKGFIENECKDGVQEKHAQASENCKKRVVKHNFGRETYENKVYKLDGLVAAEAGRGVGWMNGHIGKNGDINPSAVETYEKVRAAREKTKPLIDAGLVSALDFENDEIDEVCSNGKAVTNQPPTNINLVLKFEILDRCTNPYLIGVENSHNGIQVVHLFDREKRDVATWSVIYGNDGEYYRGVWVYVNDRKLLLKPL